MEVIYQLLLGNYKELEDVILKKEGINDGLRKLFK